MQEFANSPSLRNGIFDLLSSVKLATDANVKLLDYTIQLFKNNGLFSDYYGYHNVDHELEVTYVTLLSGIHALEDNYISRNDLNYLYASALLHDFDPDKSIDKPHEKNVIQFISKDQTIQKLLADANLDQNLICSIISRTVYPWTGDVITKTEKFMVVQGNAKFRFRNLLDDSLHEIDTSSQQPEIVESIPGWIHDISNTGSDELIVMIWANEIFDQDNPDTKQAEV